MVTADYGPEVEIQAFLQMCNIKDQKAGVFWYFLLQHTTKSYYDYYYCSESTDYCEA